MQELMDRLFLLETRLGEVLRRNASLEAENASLWERVAKLEIENAELRALPSPQGDGAAKAP